VGSLVAWPCQNSSPTPGGRGFDSYGVHKILPLQTNGGVLRRTITFNQMRTCVKKWFIHLSSSVPTLSACQLTNTVRTVQSTKFLLVWQNEQNVISFAYCVCLSPFKFCWVRKDEAYTHVCFEVILSTYIFRPSWTHFGFLDPFWIIHICSFQNALKDKFSTHFEDKIYLISSILLTHL